MFLLATSCYKERKEEKKRRRIKGFETLSSWTGEKSYQELSLPSMWELTKMAVTKAGQDSRKVMKLIFVILVAAVSFQLLSVETFFMSIVWTHRPELLVSTS